MTTKSDIDRAHQPKDMDLSAAGRGVWLVKVPKYLSEKWRSYSGGKDVGKLRITKSKIPNKKPDIVFTSFEENKPSSTPSASSSSSNPIAIIPGSTKPSIHTLAMPPSIAPVPLLPKTAGTHSLGASASPHRNHKFLLSGVGNQNLVVMSKAPSSNDNHEPVDKMSIEGKVLQRAECHPIVDASYRELKKQQMKAQNTPQRQMKLLQGVVPTYKPISDHQFNLEDKRSKKNEVKRIRAEKDKVMDILFNAFEKHQFYNVKDLVGITKQPVPYLKEILKEICNYNMTAPHKNMWELKPEFRHYKQGDGEADGKGV